MFMFVAVVQSPSCVRLFVTPWTAACRASLSLTISWGSPKFMTIALVIPSSHLTLWCPLLLLSSIFPSIRDFSEELFISDDQNTGVFHVLPLWLSPWLQLPGESLLPDWELLGRDASCDVSSIYSHLRSWAESVSVWHVNTDPGLPPPSCPSSCSGSFSLMSP